ARASQWQVSAGASWGTFLSVALVVRAGCLPPRDRLLRSRSLANANRSRHRSRSLPQPRRAAFPDERGAKRKSRCSGRSDSACFVIVRSERDQSIGSLRRRLTISIASFLVTKPNTAIGKA